VQGSGCVLLTQIAVACYWQKEVNKYYWCRETVAYYRHKKRLRIIIVQRLHIITVQKNSNSKYNHERFFFAYLDCINKIFNDYND